MNIHEYQAKHILSKYGVAIYDYRVVDHASDIEQAISSMGITQAVVKVQVHAGGRGKAGGVKLAKTTDEIKKLCSEMLGMKIVTKQTGADGIIAHQLMITELSDIEKEYYLGIIIDRENATPLLMVSPEGGMDIEEVAESSPEKILKLPLPIEGEMHAKDVAKVIKFMGWEGKTAEQAEDLIPALHKAFIENDCEILEINPLTEDKEGKLWALDAKMAIDESALFRHKEIAEMYDPSQESAAEALAHKLDLAYIALDGNIGCMVNGAGLAMATMDLIKFHGGDPANFLDVGGSATKEKVAASFNIILSDPNVKAIFVNIFGGIMKCDIIADGIIAAAKENGIKVPLVVRLQGTNVEKGRKLLQESKLSIIAVDDLTEAARTVVEKVKG